jgi:hypothetical protein
MGDGDQDPCKKQIYSTILRKYVRVVRMLTLEGEEHYSPAEAARILRLTPHRVRQMLNAGDLEGEQESGEKGAVGGYRNAPSTPCWKRDPPTGAGWSAAEPGPRRGPEKWQAPASVSLTSKRR